MAKQNDSPVHPLLKVRQLLPFVVPVEFMYGSIGFFFDVFILKIMKFRWKSDGIQLLRVESHEKMPSLSPRGLPFSCHCLYPLFQQPWHFHFRETDRCVRDSWSKFDPTTSSWLKLNCSNRLQPHVGSFGSKNTWFVNFDRCLPAY